MDKAYARKIRKGEKTVFNKEKTLAEEDKTFSERKTYLLDKESNINKRQNMLQKKHEDVYQNEENLKVSETKILRLEKLAEDYKIKAQGKGRVISRELKEKLRAFHAKEDREKEK